MPKKRRCKAVTKRGTRCQAAPLRGREWCSAHDPEAPDSTRFGSRAQAREAAKLAGRPRNPRAVDILRERVEADIERVLGPLFEMLAAERGVVVGMGEFASLEFIPDWSIRLQAIREVLDRSYGRPRQTIAHTGEEHGAPIEIELSEATASAAHEFLRAVKAARK